MTHTHVAQSTKTAALSTVNNDFIQALNALDLTRVMARVGREHSLTERQLAEAEKQYRQFLTLFNKYGAEKTLTPTRLVDMVWESHMADTRKYQADCDALFGTMLHHNPDLCLDEKAHQQAQANTRALFETEFGYVIPVISPLRDEFTKMAGCGW